MFVAKLNEGLPFIPVRLAWGVNVTSLFNNAENGIDKHRGHTIINVGVYISRAYRSSASVVLHDTAQCHNIYQTINTAIYVNDT